MTGREKLKREIYLLGQTIETNALTLASKTMNANDREALERQMRFALRTIGCCNSGWIAFHPG